MPDGEVDRADLVSTVSMCSVSSLDLLVPPFKISGAAAGVVDLSKISLSVLPMWTQGLLCNLSQSNSQGAHRWSRNQAKHFVLVLAELTGLN
jgi:hypothetical protein